MVYAYDAILHTTELENHNIHNNMDESHKINKATQKKKYDSTYM